MSTIWTVTNRCRPCVSVPPGAQNSDPTPLPDYENSSNPPPFFASTKKKCAYCPTGFVRPGPETDVEIAQVNWSIDYVVSSLWVNIAPGPAAYNFYRFEGTLDGVTWFVIYDNWYTPTVDDITLDFDPPVSFIDVRVWGYTPTVPHVWELISFVEMKITSLFTEATQQFVCAERSATSTKSQIEADTEAEKLALEAAQAQLTCVVKYTTTMEYTAKCPAETFGADVKASATGASYVSMYFAEKIALEKAKATATGQLACVSSNNTQQITINDSASPPTKATPYPSVKYVSGVSGTIAKVVVNLYKFYHTRYSEVHILLVSPEGTCVYLMGGCLSQYNPDGIERNFTIRDGNDIGYMPATGRPVGVNHTYRPTRYSQIVFPSPAPPKPPALYKTTMADLNGEDPNGHWQLYVMDNTTLEAGYIKGGWDITITTAI